jgi:hypothetical protein
MLPPPKVEPEQQEPNQPKYTGIVGAVGAVLLIAFIVLSLDKVINVKPPLQAIEKPAMVNPVTQPLVTPAETDEVRDQDRPSQWQYEQAKQLFLSWNGDRRGKALGMHYLDRIKAGDPLAKAARKLRADWEKKTTTLEKTRKAAERQAKRDRMTRFTGEGPGKVSVPEIRLRKTSGDYYAKKGAHFVFVYVAVLNTGDEMIHANPMDFSLADEDGVTSPPHISMYNLNNAFPAVNLGRNQQAAGMLVFIARDSKEYTLTRSAPFSGGNVTKTIFR